MASPGVQCLHQTYKVEDLTRPGTPAVYRPFQQAWRRLHPDWQYEFWTDQRIAEFVQAVHPAFQALFKSYRHQIQRVDLMRYLVLWTYGGWYIDLDFEPKQSLHELTRRYPDQVILGQEPLVQARKVYRRARCVGNAIMYSPPRHPFWRHVLDLAFQRSRLGPTPLPSSEVLRATGPGLLDDALRTYPNAAAQVVVLSPDAFYSKVAPGFPQHPVNSAEVVAVHHWTNTWTT